MPKNPELDYPPGLDKDIINAIGATSLITLVGFAMLQCQAPLSQTPSPRGVFARTDGGAPGGNPGEDLARLARLVCRFWLCAGPFYLFAVLCFGSKCKADERTQIKTDEPRMEENNCKTGPKGLEQSKRRILSDSKKIEIVLALKEKGVELGTEVFFRVEAKTKNEAWETTC